MLVVTGGNDNKIGKTKTEILLPGATEWIYGEDYPTWGLSTQAVSLDNNIFTIGESIDWKYTG